MSEPIYKQCFLLKKPAIKFIEQTISKHSTLPELSNIDLKVLLSNKKLNYIGSVSKDKLMTYVLPKIRSSTSFIVNLQNSEDGSGTHWVMCYYIKLNDRQIIYYFDPMGQIYPMAVDEFAEYMSKLFNEIETKLIYSPVDIQKYGSASCGWWCAIMIIGLSAIKNMNIPDGLDGAIVAVTKMFGFKKDSIAKNEARLYDTFAALAELSSSHSNL